jgi:ATP adenylyltransferase/5',5'''-P-1,P-4-tetraphosphate phosphorylase II
MTKTAVKKKKPASSTPARKSLEISPDAIEVNQGHLNTLVSVIRDFDDKKINVHKIFISPTNMYIEISERNGHITGKHKIIMS